MSILVIGGTREEGMAAVAAATRAGVWHLVYLSAYHGGASSAHSVLQVQGGGPEGSQRFGDAVHADHANNFFQNDLVYGVRL